MAEKPSWTGADDGYSPETAQWLEDSGRRRAIRPEESPQALLKCLEELSGRQLTTKQDIVDYLTELKTRSEEMVGQQRRLITRRSIVRECVFLVALLAAVGQYYFWDVTLQISKLQKVFYFVPGPTAAADWRNLRYGTGAVS